MSGKAALIVEDETEIREMFRLALEIEGYTVYVAANGKEGLNVLREISKPCVIFLDLMMPIMNGWQFVEELRKDDQLKSIPVVVVTAFNERTRPIDAQNILKKPVDLDILFKTADQYC
jgi:CheY-like chemotaxis protein